MYHPETTPAKAGAATVTPHETFRYHHVEQQILAMIESGRFAAGDRLPSLRSLCSSMGVSLATVNHAYMELERKGIIEARPRSGYFVRKPGVPLPLPVTEQSTPEIGEENRTNLIQMVLEAVGNKNLISFGCVTPDPALLPGKALARIMQDVTRLSTYDSLSYEVIQGNPELRRQIAWRGQELGLAVQSEDVLITVGTMEALHITLRALTHPGDSVVIQSPTYFCLVQLLENLGLRAIEVPSSPEHGISPAALHEAITKFDVAACILSPNFNNPDGSLMPDEAKREIVDMLARRGVPLVEDDVAGDVHFGPSRPTPLKSFDRKDNVTLCSSFSKTIAPGYRCGWMLPGKIMRKALEIKATTNVCCASPTQMVVAEFLRQGLYERHLKRLRVATERQMQTIQHHLATYFPEGTGVTRPKGGGFLWVSLPEKVDSVQLFKEAKSQGILISPGPIFTTRDQFRNYIRLSCCGVWHERMEHGLKTLGELAGKLA